MREHSGLRILGVFLLSVLLCGACAQKPKTKRSSFDFSEAPQDDEEKGSSGDLAGPVASDAGRKSGDSPPGICERLANFEVSQLQAAEVDEEEPKSRSWAPDSKKVVFHTLEESLLSQNEWGAFVDHVHGHLQYSIKGFPPIVAAWYRAEDPEIPPVKALHEMMERCKPSRGLFHNVGGPVFTGDRLHMFECAPGMERLKWLVDADHTVPRTDIPQQLRSAWRIGDAVVKCDYPRLHVEFVTSSHPDDEDALVPFDELPGHVRTWFDEMWEVSKENYENFIRPDEGRPDGWWPLADRYFYLGALRRGYRDGRLVQYDKHVGGGGCGSTAGGICRRGKGETYWKGPQLKRHWKYLGAYESLL